MENDNSQMQSSSDGLYDRDSNAIPLNPGAAPIEQPTAPDKLPLKTQITEKAAAVVSNQKDGLADRIDDLAKTVHNSGDQFAGKQDWIAGAIERGATELGSLANSLRQNDLSSLLTQVTSLARRQPVLFVGASLAAGFAVARLGKIVASDVSRDDLPNLPEVGHGNN